MTSPHLSPAIEGGPLLFVSGQLAFGADGQLVGRDITAQTGQVLANLAAVLAQFGLGKADVIKTTIWIRDAADFAAFNEAYAEFFGCHRPARSTVVSGLALDEAVVEIEAIALLRSTPL